MCECMCVVQLSLNKYVHMYMQVCLHRCSLQQCSVAIAIVKQLGRWCEMMTLREKTKLEIETNRSTHVFAVYILKNMGKYLHGKSCSMPIGRENQDSIRFDSSRFD